MTELKKPFLLKPTGKDYLWGGNRLNDEFGKNIEMSPLAETWECSTHPDGPSVIVNGEFSGMTLTEALRQHPEFLGTHSGTHPGFKGDLPILIKLIDAKKDLSIQVHPTDRYAAEKENGQLGKTEMWYVLDASKDARIIYGLNHTIDRATFETALSEGTVEKYLQKIRIHKDELYFIEAGTIHAIGAGTLVAEIQENSNLTYRLYDYDRVDKNGNKRELHIEKALDVARLQSMAEPRQPLRVLRYQPGSARELLCRCEYFEVYRMVINTEKREQVIFRADSVSFRVLLCLNGCGSLSFPDGVSLTQMEVYKGDCIFVPADSEEITMKGQMQFLDVRG